MIWLFLLPGLIAVLIAIFGRKREPVPSRRDHGGSGMMLMDGAPLLGTDPGAMGLHDNGTYVDSHLDEDRFEPGGGDFGGAGATGSWDDNASDSSDDWGSGDSGGGDGGGGDGGGD